MPMPGLLTFGQVADRMGVPLWRLDRAYRRGLLPETAGKIGRYNIYKIDDLPKIRQALDAAGYLQRSEPVAVGV